VCALICSVYMRFCLFRVFERNLFFFLCIFLCDVFLVVVVVCVRRGWGVFESSCCEKLVVGNNLGKLMYDCESFVCWGFQVLVDSQEEGIYWWVSDLKKLLYGLKKVLFGLRIVLCGL